jgi:hypothetical protein
VTAYLFEIERAPQWRTAARAVNRSEYARRLVAMLGNGADWGYRAICVDLQRCTGKCSCGHTGLRYLFTLHNVHDGQTAIVGSTCVNNYASISPALSQRLAADAARLQAAAADRDARAAEAAASAEVQKLMAAWSEAEYRTDAAIVAWLEAHPSARWLPDAIYRRPCAAERLAERQPDRLHPYCRVPALITAAGQAARLRQYLAECAAELTAVTSGRPTALAGGRLLFAV